MMAATHISCADGPWSLRLYDYVQRLSRSRIAWEYLRRNPDYRRDWLNSTWGRAAPVALASGALLLRLRRRFERAESWGLCSFRRS